MSSGKRLLDTFAAPRPNRVLIAAMVPVNRTVMLRGLPLLRDIPPLNRIPGIRGVASIRQIDFPEQDRARLASVCGAGRATFLVPNHPEFFTDWMIDKEIQSKVAPMCASWATNAVVNGLGRVVQRFWLANNLIAQIPGNSGPARTWSVDWAIRGHGVLLHPEGSVGWHGDHVATLMPGAAEMGLDALERCRRAATGMDVWIAPVVWKLVFRRDVERALRAECTYVEYRLGLGSPGRQSSAAERVFAIYDALLRRDEETFGLAPQGSGLFAQRWDATVRRVSQRLAQLLPASPDPQDDIDLLRRGRQFLREAGKAGEAAAAVRGAMNALQRLKRIGPFAWAKPTMTQENTAEHLKRIRADYCKGTVRDTLNAYVPQAAGLRDACIRVPEPLRLNAFPGTPEEAMQEIRRRMQAALDAVNARLAAEGRFRFCPNPFYAGESIEPAAA